MDYKYKVKVVYPNGCTEMVGTNNLFYAKWVFKTETEAGCTCKFYVNDNEGYIEV